MPERVNPFPGNRVRRAEALTEGFTSYSGESPERPVVDLDQANLLTSEFATGPFDAINHRPVLDIDFPAKLVPSTTDGHYHLYLDKPMTWSTYRSLLTALVEAGIIEEGYAEASISRGYSAVRLPWVRKEA